MPIFQTYSDVGARSLLGAVGELIELTELSFVETGDKQERFDPPYDRETIQGIYNLDLGNQFTVLNRMMITRLSPTTGGGELARNYDNFQIMYTYDEDGNPITIDIEIRQPGGGTFDERIDSIILFYEQLPIVYEPVTVCGIFDEIITENTDTVVSVLVQQPNVLFANNDIMAIQPSEAMQSPTLDRRRWTVKRQSRPVEYEISDYQRDEVSTTRYLLREI